VTFTLSGVFLKGMNGQKTMKKTPATPAKNHAELRKHINGLRDVTFDTPARICNTSTQGNYSPPSWSVRAGAADFLAIPRRGV